MRALKISLLVCLCFLLSACSSFRLSVTDLMQAPKLTEKQAEIYDALTRAVGAPDVRLKYPKSGQYRSAFVMFDLDGDGEDEALVFYQMQSWGGNTRLMVLDQDENGWRNVYDAAGEGSEIVEIEFHKLTDSGKYNILVGWEKGSADSTHLYIYEYENFALELLYDSEYTTMLIADIDEDGTDEAILATRKLSSGSANIRLVNDSPEGLQMLSRVVMEQNVQEFLSIQIGNISQNRVALFIDTKTAGEAYTTEIMVLNEQGKLRSLYNYGENIVPDFWRTLPLACKDYSGDGFIDIPMAIVRPEGDAVTDETAAADQLQFMHLLNADDLDLLQTDEQAEFIFTPSFLGYVNAEYGFLLRYPDDWTDAVVVQQDRDISQWTFSLAPDGGEETPQLSLRVYQQGEAKDTFETLAYEKVSQRGIYEYYIAVVPQAGGENSLDLEAAKNLFALIKP